MVGLVKMITIEMVGKVGLWLFRKVIPVGIAQVLNVGCEIMKRRINSWDLAQVTRIEMLLTGMARPAGGAGAWCKVRISASCTLNVRCLVDMRKCQWGRRS